MPAPLISKIGSAASGRDYATLALWLAALPTDLTTGGTAGIYVAELYNDSAFSFPSPGIGVSFGGHTTDATHYLVVRAAAGHSWRDVDRAPVPSQANGVLIKYDSDHRTNVFMVNDAWTVFDGLQFDGSKSAITVEGSNNSGRVTIRNCVFRAFMGGILHINAATNGSVDLTNCFFWVAAGQIAVGVDLRTSRADRIVNNTFVCPEGQPGGMFITNAYAAFPFAVEVRNNFFCNLSAICETSVPDTGSNNATTGAAVGFGTSNLVSRVAATELRGPLTSGADFRLKLTGATLQNAGTAVAGFTSDVFGTARPQGSAYDIGAYEVVVASAAPVRPVMFVVQ